MQIEAASDANGDHRGGSSALETAGHPVIRIILRDILDLGGEFFLGKWPRLRQADCWSIDPFDQPNLGNDNTKALRAEFAQPGNSRSYKPLLESDGLKIYGDAAHLDAAGASVGSLVAEFLGRRSRGDYL